VWRGFRNPELTLPQFFDKLARVFIPVAMQMQRIYGLAAYLPAVLPVEKADCLPDEVALVFYETQEAYRATKEYPGGRAYSDLHAIVFSLARSQSEFPQAFAGSLQPRVPYHLLADRADWQLSPVELWVGVRRAEISPDRYLDELTGFARNLQACPTGIEGAILCPHEDWLLYWECGLCVDSAHFRSLEAVANPAFHATATPITIPPLLTDKFEQVPVRGGEFYNTQFPRI
jgi:hypothetical protein